MASTIPEEGLALLERQEPAPRPAVSEAEEFRQELAGKSAALLGYKPIQERVGAEARNEIPEEALAELGIRPFTTLSVKHYQDWMVKNDLGNLKGASTRVRFKHWIEETPSGLLTAGVWMMLCALSILALVLVSPTAYIVGATWASDFLLVASATTVISFMVSVGLGAYLDTKKTKALGRWLQIPIKEYERPIPTFALTTAIALKERLPEAQFFVDEFQEGEFVTAPNWEPFLVMKSAGQEFYLEVWAEPDFHGQRQK